MCVYKGQPCRVPRLIENQGEVNLPYLTEAEGEEYSAGNQFKNPNWNPHFPGHKIDITRIMYQKPWLYLVIIEIVSAPVFLPNILGESL